MSDKIKQTLANLHDLATRGATEGEKNAARKAMDRIIKKYNLTDINPDNLRVKTYRFKYSTKMEKSLLSRLCRIMLETRPDAIYECNYNLKGEQVRELEIELDEIDYITIETSYEYFRRHMKGEWNKFAKPILDRCRKSSTRRKKRELLQEDFYSRYIIASGLYEEGELKRHEIKSRAELERIRALSGVEGGQYNKQINNGLYLEP